METQNWKDLLVYQKTSKSILLRIKKNNTIQDLTGWIIYFTVKSKLSDPDTSAIITKDITDHIDAPNGKTLIELTPEDTDIDAGSYYYDIITKDTQENISLIANGRMTVNKHATTRY
jgi:hypothetical protein